jgi:hypothetical protein
MYLSLLVVGIMATASGVAMVGFGISIKEFSLGNTLLITGTTALIGGLILIGLAGAVRQLRRIAEALMARPAPRAARPFEPGDPQSFGQRAGSGPARMPFPPKPNSPARGPAPLEPRFASAPSIDASKEGAFDRPHSPLTQMASAPEPEARKELDENPLSPRGPHDPQTELRFGLTEVVEEAIRMEIAAGSFSPTATEVLPVSRLDQTLRSPPPAESAGQSGLFDSLWPADSRPRKAPIPEPQPDTSEAPAANKTKGDEDRKQDEAPADSYVVSILKSGVIDGMAYTLYSDGAIEAELPQGTVRFGSVAELREHLEKIA